MSPHTPEDGRKHQEVEVRDGDHAVTSAEVSTSAEPQGTARVSLHAQAGHLAPGSRSDLVDAVLDLPEVRDSAHIEASVPVGDTESLNRLRERTEDMSTRAAGSSALVEADLHTTHPQDADATESPDGD